MVKVICPRCGRQGYTEIHNVAGKKYLYVVHREGKKRTKCYIGPVEGYDHADRLLTLGLTNIQEIDYLEVSINALLRFIVEIEEKRTKDLGEKQDALEKLKRAEKELASYLEDIAKLKKEFEEEIAKEEARKFV
jgi:hypothetical protein